jgi:hypothetical protein
MTATPANSDRPWMDGMSCVVCGWPVDAHRGARSPANMLAHQTCVRRWAALIDEAKL